VPLTRRILEEGKPRSEAVPLAALRATATRAPTASRAALVVCDEFPVHWATPFSVDGEGLAQRATLLERELPLP